MAFYAKYVLPRLLHFACGLKPVRLQRAKIIPNAQGRVVEIGIGTGLNLPFYDARKVTGLIGIEPAAQMRAMARAAAARMSFPVEILDADAQDLALASASADSIVMTYCLCSIAQPLRAVKQLHRVIKPAGRLLFCEHGAAPEENMRRWQRRLNPLWKRMCGGCHLDRAIPALLEEGGFRIEQLETMYLPGTPRFAGFNYWGSARAV
jgi:ubiquinone/menaquinone biosynthesis C-methylase UbiE